MPATVCDITPLEMLSYTVLSACGSARLEGTSTARIKADTAERVLSRIASEDTPLSANELLAVNERMNRAAGNAERTVAVSMLEVIIGVGIRRAV